MRELQFRAWDKKGKKFVEDHYGAKDEVYAGSWFRFTDALAEVANDDNLIVEQFTGLKDGNGNDIYEGDIVRCGANDFGKTGMVYKVVYSLNSFVYVRDDKPDETCYYAQHLTEVIGNIHENLELL